MVLVKHRPDDPSTLRSEGYDTAPAVPKRPTGPRLRTNMHRDRAVAMPRTTQRRLPAIARLVTCIVAAVSILFLPGPVAMAATKPYVVVLRPGADRAAAVAYAQSIGGTVTRQYRYALNGYAADLPDAAVAAIEGHASDVMFVSPDQAIQPADQTLPTGVDRIDGDRSSTRSGDGKGSVGINVAVIDSGIDLAHPDLNVVGGVDCAGGQGFNDPVGHGTHVGGIIGARDDGAGVVGVAPGARLWAVRVLSKGGGTESDVICGVDFVTSTKMDADPSNDIAVANMSLAGKGSDDGNCGTANRDAMHMAICRSVAAGVTYVVAAGNSGGDLQGTVPAAYDEVLTATAMTDFDGRPGGLGYQGCLSGSAFVDDTAAYFSNFATLPGDQAHTIGAPGVCILSTWPGGYAVESGTSMASPHVAGTVALCIASGKCAGLAPAQIVQKMIADAAAYSAKAFDYGFGGDPIHNPDPSKFYGYLVRAATY